MIYNILSFVLRCTSHARTHYAQRYMGIKLNKVTNFALEKQIFRRLFANEHKLAPEKFVSFALFVSFVCSFCSLGGSLGRKGLVAGDAR